MQELRLVAVSEDGTYLVLATAGRGTRFTLPVDDRLRAAIRGHFSRLGQFEIEVESPLRPKEIQARIRSGETAEEIAESAGIPVERVRWFEGPVLQEREYMAQQAQRVTVRRPGESTPGPPLGETVEERLGRGGVDLEEAEWDSWKCEDGTWRVRLSFFEGGRPHAAEWTFDPRRRHVSPLDEVAARLTSVEWDDDDALSDTVTPLVPRRPAMKVVGGDREARGVPAEPEQPGPAAPSGPLRPAEPREYIVERGRMIDPHPPFRETSEAAPLRETAARPGEPPRREHRPQPAAPARPRDEDEPREASGPRAESEPAPAEPRDAVRTVGAARHGEERERREPLETVRSEPAAAEEPRTHEIAQSEDADADVPETSADVSETPGGEVHESAVHDGEEYDGEEYGEAERESAEADLREAPGDQDATAESAGAHEDEEPVAEQAAQEPAAAERGEAPLEAPDDGHAHDEDVQDAAEASEEAAPAPAGEPVHEAGEAAVSADGEAAPTRPQAEPAAPAAAQPEPAAPEAAEPAPAKKPPAPRQPQRAPAKKKPASRPTMPAAAQEKPATGSPAASGEGAASQRPARRRKAKGKRASVPSWDEIMFGARRPE
ncbi:septation protein SepH [Actinomadura monticuli]|uniref:Septation protein SepH n=1 Tax=Actinomadura monticuli TaxID=3097367 RepID=A0ABV4Q651_9ACTN